MRLDYLSIFPAYFDVLDISLLGKAAADGLVEVHAHDLRDWTHDRHRTVDDTPCGGGAGMVMKPDPWGEAFDEIIGTEPDSSVHVIFPSRQVCHLPSLLLKSCRRQCGSCSVADGTRGSTTA